MAQEEIEEYTYLANNAGKGGDYYRVVQNTPAVQIVRLPEQLPPKGWGIRTQHRRSNRGKKEIKRLGNIIHSNIIKYVKL